MNLFMNPPSGNREIYRAIGVMSGSSLDGLDLAACTFTRYNNRWTFSIDHAVTLAYPPEWEAKLAGSRHLNGEELQFFHSRYGKYIGEKVNDFIRERGFRPDLIASHGHTVFHQPEKGFTFQAGNGAAIAAETGITTVADFRIADVGLGGQGAPLVPAGDRYLFPGYDFWLNLGGFGNISMMDGTRIIAFDICPVNYALNHFSRLNGKPYDDKGNTGKTGKVDTSLLDQLNRLLFYKLQPPKSLGREWMEKIFFPCIENASLPVQDLLRTIYEHIAQQIAGIIDQPGKLLATGGGVYNTFLMELICEKAAVDVEIPGDEIIQYKEALIFAFLGVLRLLGEVNCFASVTGARKDSSCGAVFLP